LEQTAVRAARGGPGWNRGRARSGRRVCATLASSPNGL